MFGFGVLLIVAAIIANIVRQGKIKKSFTTIAVMEAIAVAVCPVSLIASFK